MKITTLLMLCIILLLGLIVYSLGVRVHVDVKPRVTEHTASNPPKGTESGTKNPPEGTKNPPQKVYQNEAFKGVELSEKSNNILVKGQARVFEGVFQYRVTSAGKQILLQDQYQTEGAPAWGDFEISFDKSLSDKKGATLELFVYSAKDGSEIDVLSIPLDK